LLTVITFVLMLSGEWEVRVPFLLYIELASMMTSVPFALSVASLLYQFSLMVVFVREVLSGVILLSALVLALTMAQSTAWVMGCAVGLAYLKSPLTRWVD